MMWKITRRSLRARPFRFVLTTFAVLLGVAFVTASFVLSDSLGAIFDKVGTSIAAPIDAQVRGIDPLAGPGDTAFESQRPPIPASVLDTVEDVPGVQVAGGTVGGFVAASTPDGRAITSGQAPVLAFNWGEEVQELSDFRLLDGGAMPGPGTVDIDVEMADKYDLAVGDTLVVQGPGASGEYTVAGIIEFGENNENGGGAFFVLMDLPTAQSTFNLAGQFQTIEVKAEEGVNSAELLDRLAQAVPEGVEVISAQAVGEEFSEAFDQIVSVIRNLLLGFAGVALFVATFLLSNVFNITLGQRLRELALLRAIGARNSQVTRSVLVEGLLIGTVGSVLGALGGVAVGALLKYLFSLLGGLPAGPLVLSFRTWLVAFAVGIGVTLLTSTLPALRAGRVPPLAAMREGTAIASGRPTSRLIVGGLFSALGAALLIGTLFGNPGTTAALLFGLIGGAVSVFLGVAFLSPLIARPAALAIGLPFQLLGIAGGLGRRNAARNPLRTSRTAFALMIGLALVSMVGVVGESVKRSFAEQIDRGVTADYFMTPTTGGTSFSPELAAELAELPEVVDVTTFRVGRMRVDGETKSVTAVTAGGFAQTVNLGLSAGSAEDLRGDALLIHADVAEDRALSVGDTVGVVFPGSTASATGDAVALRVAAVFEDSAGGAVGNWIITQETFAAHFPPDLQNDAYGGFSLAAGVDADRAEQTIASVAARYPGVTVEDRAAFKETQQSQLDDLLVIVYGLLLFSLVIAALGIAITLALSVFERTRELGLLRAVGQRKGQVWVMVISESVIVSTFGAVLGLVLGTVFGLTIVAALPESVVTVTALPIPLFVVVLIGAAVVGVAAAMVPAFRASRLKVLDAIAYE